MPKSLRFRLCSMATLPAWLFAGAAGAIDPGVSVCDSLTLYGNAANSGLCSELSPANGGIRKCVMPHVKQTYVAFNSGGQLHLSVTGPTPTCRGASFLTGSWPGGLAMRQGDFPKYCEANLNDQLARLNAVPQVPPAGQSNCRAGFLAAAAAGRIPQSILQSYLDACAAQACP